jgi:hypothetical protein
MDRSVECMQNLNHSFIDSEIVKSKAALEYIHKIQETNESSNLYILSVESKMSKPVKGFRLESLTLGLDYCIIITFKLIPLISIVLAQEASISCYNKLRSLCLGDTEDKWLQQLESTRLLQNLRPILSNAVKLVEQVDTIGNTCLLIEKNSETGSDRLSQILALAQLLLDPYYRTIQGFISFRVVDLIVQMVFH